MGDTATSPSAGTSSTPRGVQMLAGSAPPVAPAAKVWTRPRITNTFFQVLKVLWDLKAHGSTAYFMNLFLDKLNEERKDHGMVELTQEKVEHAVSGARGRFIDQDRGMLALNQAGKTFAETLFKSTAQYVVDPYLSFADFRENVLVRVTLREGKDTTASDLEVLTSISEGTIAGIMNALMTKGIAHCKELPAMDAEGREYTERYYRIWKQPKAPRVIHLRSSAQRTLEMLYDLHTDGKIPVQGLSADEVPDAVKDLPQAVGVKEATISRSVSPLAAHGLLVEVPNGGRPARFAMSDLGIRHAKIVKGESVEDAQATAEDSQFVDGELPPKTGHETQPVSLQPHQDDLDVDELLGDLEDVEEAPKPEPPVKLVVPVVEGVSELLSLSDTAAAKLQAIALLRGETPQETVEHLIEKFAKLLS